MQFVGCWHRRTLEQMRKVHCSGAPASGWVPAAGLVGSLMCRYVLSADKEINGCLQRNASEQVKTRRGRGFESRPLRQLP